MHTMLPMLKVYSGVQSLHFLHCMRLAHMHNQFSTPRKRFNDAPNKVGSMQSGPGGRQPRSSTYTVNHPLIGVPNLTHTQFVYRSICIKSNIYIYIYVFIWIYIYIYIYYILYIPYTNDTRFDRGWRWGHPCQKYWRQGESLACKDAEKNIVHLYAIIR